MLRFRKCVAFASIALLAGACSIQAPDVQLVSEGGAPVPSGRAVAGDSGVVDLSGTSVSPGAVSAGAQGASATQSSCTGKATDVGVTGNLIKLGSNFAVSGPVSNISGPILKGVQAYFNKINDAGGIYGRKLYLRWYDDGWDAQRGKGFIKRLVEQDRVFVLAVNPSSNGLDAAKDYLEQKQVPVFGTSGLIESQFASPMQWPVGTSTKSASRISLVYLKERHVRSLAVIWLDLLAGREAMDATRNGIAPIIGVQPKDFLINTQGYRVSISEPDFGPVWARIIQDTKAFQTAHKQPVNGRPDFVTLAIDPTNAIKALQAAENIGFRPGIGWGGGAPLFLDLVPQGSDYAAKTGLLAGTSFYPPIGKFLSMPAVADYVATVRKYFGNSVDLHNPYLEGGYAGAALTVEILKRAGPCLTRAAAVRVANSLSGYSAAGLTPPLSYSPVGHGAGHYGNTRGFTVRCQQDGSWVMARDFVADPHPGAA